MESSVKQVNAEDENDNENDYARLIIPNVSNLLSVIDRRFQLTAANLDFRCIANHG
jgi:hypothetical protein